jgi:probable rRNA maturation factor
VTDVEVSGAAIPRLSRREIVTFTRKVLVTLYRFGNLPEEISEVSIAFIDDAAMKSLNRKYRGKHRTTDVLTFPADEDYADPDQYGRPLGDIVISVEQAKRQAEEQRHSLATEIRYLILHGVIHALGYDHETDEGEMNELEMRVRAKVGLE